MLKMWNFVFLLIFCGITYAIPQDRIGKTEEVFTWKKIEYENLTELERSFVGPYEYYIPENNDIIGMGFHAASGLMIVNILRTRPGVPTSLGAFCIMDYKQHKVGSSPKIWGFPNSEINSLLPGDFDKGPIEMKPSFEPQYESDFNNFSDYSEFNFSYNQVSTDETYAQLSSVEPSENPRIISAFFVTIDDRCNRVFLVDNGQLNYNQNATYVIQKPALLVIDLPEDGCVTRNFSIIRRSELPDRITAKGSNGFMGITLDYQTEDKCDELFAYIPNAFYSFLVVYDFKKDSFWAFEHSTFLPIIAESHFIFDKSFPYNLKFGIYSVALSYYPDKYGGKAAYYTPLASTVQYAVSTRILKDRMKSPTNYEVDDFQLVGYRGCDHQSNAMVSDQTYGVMFYTEVQSNEIRCWNMSKPLNPDNIGVVYHSEKLLLGIQISIDSLGYLWFHSCRIPVDFLSDFPLDLEEINSRFFRIKVEDAIRGTVCE